MQETTYPKLRVQQQPTCAAAADREAQQKLADIIRLQEGKASKFNMTAVRTPSSALMCTNEELLLKCRAVCCQNSQIKAAILAVDACLAASCVLALPPLIQAG